MYLNYNVDNNISFTTKLKCHSVYASIMDEFINSDNSIAEVVLENRTLHGVYQGLHKVIRKRNIDYITAHIRGHRVFLQKEKL